MTYRKKANNKVIAIPRRIIAKMINSKNECNLLRSENSANVQDDNSFKLKLDLSFSTIWCDEHRCFSTEMIVLLIVGVCFSVMCKSFYVTSLPFVFGWSILLTSRVIAGSHPHPIIPFSPIFLPLWLCISHRYRGLYVSALEAHWLMPCLP